ncbi:MAG TPA: DUF6178 family protein, partial [Planctomycetota bacterium]|nr:DUF6178 family protein [Planctomycetota bacterium]
LWKGVAHKQKLDPQNILEWMEALKQCEPDAIRGALAQVDIKVLAAMLQPFVTLGEHTDIAKMGDDLGTPFHFTPDDLVERSFGTGEGADGGAVDTSVSASDVREFIEYLFDIDPETFGDICRVMIAEDPEYIENQVRADRQKRLLELGFAHPDRVAELFTPKVRKELEEALWAAVERASAVHPHGPAAEAAAGGALAAASRQGGDGGGYYMRLLENSVAKGWITPGMQHSILNEVTEVTNAAMQAMEIEVGDATAARPVMERVRGALDLTAEAMVTLERMQPADLFGAYTAGDLFRIALHLQKSLQLAAYEVLEARGKAPKAVKKELQTRELERSLKCATQPIVMWIEDLNKGHEGRPLASLREWYQLAAPLQAAKFRLGLHLKNENRFEASYLRGLESEQIRRVYADEVNSDPYSGGGGGEA